MIPSVDAKKVQQLQVSINQIPYTVLGDQRWWVNYISEIIAISRAVSYTHLDVYKRQASPSEIYRKLHVQYYTISKIL